MRTLHNLVEDFLLFLLLDSGSRFVAAGLWRSKRIRTFARGLDRVGGGDPFRNAQNLGATIGAVPAYDQAAFAFRFCRCRT